MDRQEKKPYVKPQVESQKIEIGVYGCYHDDTGSTHPVKDRKWSGGTDLSG